MPNDAKLTLIEHLDELRIRIIKSIVVLILFFVLTFFYVESILGVLIRPVGRLVFIAPQEAFIANIKVAFFGGLFISIPYILFQVWQFISVALTEKESRLLNMLGPLSILFFYLGALFCYFVIVPIGLRFLLSFSSDVVRPAISISKYISFVGSLTFVFGIIFELPLVTLFLTKIGIINPYMLQKGRRYAIVLIFILAAILTPPDVVTQCLMALPLIVLYEIGIIFSKLSVKKDVPKE